MATVLKVLAIVVFLISLVLGGFWVAIGSLVVMWVLFAIIVA